MKRFTVEVTDDFMKFVNGLKNPEIRSKLVPQEGENQSSSDLSLQETLNISDDTIRRLYECGNHAYEKNNFVGATGVFLLLMTLNPYIMEFWMALGMIQEKQGHTEQALNLFALGSLNFPSEPLFRVHLISCYLSLGQTEDAKLELEALTQISQQYPQLNLEKQIAALSNKIINGV